MARRRMTGLALATAFSLTLAACGGDNNNTGGGGTGNTNKKDVLVFGSSADPVNMDGAYISDGESARVVDQIFETLVTTKLGGTEIEGKLAETYSASPDGLAWTFKLRKNVKFHDGTPFNAAAVCFNFDRWYNFKGVQQSPSVAYYWTTVFGGFKTKDLPDSSTDSLYKSCQASADDTAVITLTKRSASFLSGLALFAFSIGSPDAIKKYQADKVSGTGDAPKFEGTYGLQHPTGTGPYKFVSFTPKDRLVLERNDDYWGAKAKIKSLIFKAIPDKAARRQALERGEIQGYDNVDPADLDGLRGKGFQILERPAFNVAYVGFNLAKAPLDNIKIRQAIAHALNREALLRAKYPPGAEVATQFMPPQLFGYNPDVTKYDYNVETAKRLIAESGVANPTLEFWYPTSVSRPYMPDPVANFQAFKADLEAVGFKVTPKAAPWNPDYLDAVNVGKPALRLLGWTGDFGDPDNFLGTFFQSKQPAWGFDNKEIFDKLNAAEVETDQEKRTQLYKDANKLIMDFLPGVPYAHTKPALALASDVKGYITSPVSLEPFSIVSFG